MNFYGVAYVVQAVLPVTHRERFRAHILNIRPAWAWLDLPPVA
jgi:hypothetical protein